MQCRRKQVLGKWYFIKWYKNIKTSTNTENTLRRYEKRITKIMILCLVCTFRDLFAMVRSRRATIKTNFTTYNQQPHTHTPKVLTENIARVQSKSTAEPHTLHHVHYYNATCATIFSSQILASRFFLVYLKRQSTTWKYWKIRIVHDKTKQQMIRKWMTIT